MITTLKVQNFRSYLNSSFNFSPSANIIVGPNTAGKTNILEAILFSRTGSSYRAKDLELIRFKKSWLRIECEDDGSKRIIKVRNDQKPNKTYEINGRQYNRLPISLKLPVVIFEPNHLQLLSGSPEKRRNYLDSFLAQLASEYPSLIKKYARALAQRNSLLKRPVGVTNSQLFPRNIRLSQLAGQIVQARNNLIDEINKTLPDIYMGLSKDKVRLLMTYKTQFNPRMYETSYLKQLESDLRDDLRTGFTLHGPHRDDFTVLYNNHPSTSYASRGELRTAVLALKITELNKLDNIKGTKPVILLDDVYSELDSVRRKSLTGYLKDNQSFITTTDADVVLKNLDIKSKVIEL